MLINLPIIGIKKETIPYQKETLSSDDYHYNINQDIELSNNFETYKQKIVKADYSKLNSISGKRSRGVKFSLDWYKGSGLTSPNFLDIIESCGFHYYYITDILIITNNNSDYNRIPATIEIAYIEENLSERQSIFSIFGAMGMIKFKCMVGKPYNLEFSFLGCDGGIRTNESKIIPSNLDDFKPHVIMNYSATIFNVEIFIESFEIICGNVLSLFSNLQNNCGYDGSRITDNFTTGVLILKEPIENIEVFHNSLQNKTTLSIIDNDTLLQLGSIWSDLGQQFGQAQIRSLSYLGNGICLAGTNPDGYILRSTDYGLTWSNLGQQFGQEFIWTIIYLDNGICLAGTSETFFGTIGLILRSTDYGLTWSNLGQQFGQAHILSLSYLGNGICLAGTQPDGKILRSICTNYSELVFNGVQLTTLNDNFTKFDIEVHDSIEMKQSTI